jgi:hypothetical protein
MKQGSPRKVFFFDERFKGEDVASLWREGETGEKTGVRKTTRSIFVLM